jgi:hypothetical protein
VNGLTPVIAGVPENLAKIVPEAPTVTSLVPSGSWPTPLPTTAKPSRDGVERKASLRSVPHATNRVPMPGIDDRVLNAETYALGRLAGGDGSTS